MLCRALIILTLIRCVPANPKSDYPDSVSKPLPKGCRFQDLITELADWKQEKIPLSIKIIDAGNLPELRDIYHLPAEIYKTFSSAKIHCRLNKKAEVVIHPIAMGNRLTCGDDGKWRGSFEDCTYQRFCLASRAFQLAADEGYTIEPAAVFNENYEMKLSDVVGKHYGIRDRTVNTIYHPAVKTELKAQCQNKYWTDAYPDQGTIICENDTLVMKLKDEHQPCRPLEFQRCDPGNWKLNIDNSYVLFEERHNELNVAFVHCQPGYGLYMRGGAGLDPEASRIVNYTVTCDYASREWDSDALEKIECRTINFYKEYEIVKPDTKFIERAMNEKKEFTYDKSIYAYIGAYGGTALAMTVVFIYQIIYMFSDTKKQAEHQEKEHQLS